MEVRQGLQPVLDVGKGVTDLALVLREMAMADWALPTSWIRVSGVVCAR